MRQKISPATITTNDQITYYIMTEEEVYQEIDKTTRHVNEVLGLPSLTLVRLILNHFHWDKEAVTERFFEDPERLFQTLRVADPNLSPSLQWDPLSPAITPKRDPLLALSQSITDSANNTCRTCCSEKPANEFYVLPCRHQHCLTCWQDYLQWNIVSSASRQAIYCPSRCVQVIDDEAILKLLADNANLRERYQRALIDAFVESNRLTHWCPGDKCSAVIKLKSYATNRAQMIECDLCQTSSCFQCCKQWHEPLQCSVLQSWEQKNQDESMTGKWILANTKVCPKCQTSIEKNGGCNHMTCRKPGCGYEFCWLCLGDWAGHATQQCNVYRAEETEKTQSEAREILARYMHYFARYEAHHQSLQFEEKLLEQVEKRKREMENKGMSYTERQSIQKAFEVLQQCRRTLKYTYPFAFYLEKCNQSVIFEENQADLERATEILSGFLEKEIQAKENLTLKLRDQTSYCDRRRKILIDHCKDGYKDHYWDGLDSQ